MAGLIKAETLIGRWLVPLKGTLRGMPPYSIPEDALYDSLNAIVREGAITVRPGLTKFDPTMLGARPVGAFSTILLASGAFQADAFQNDAFQLTANTPGDALLVVTPLKVWAYFGGAWHDLTDTALTAQDGNHARVTAIQISNAINLVITNGVDTPRRWDTTSPTVSTLTGAPLWSDVTTASDRIIGIIPPYTVRWGNSLDLSTWPALNFRALADTIDPVVAIRNLGTLGVVVYKSRSIWIGAPGGTTDASYFAFVIRGFWDGPASPAAVVDADGIHYYMTNLGRVGVFDGTQQQWVADGVWPAVRDELDQAYSGRIFGVYEPLNNEVNFYYPRTGDAGICKGIVTLKLPTPAEGHAIVLPFRGKSEIAVSCGTDTRLLTDRRAVVFGDQTQVGYEVIGARDDTTEFSGYWQSGLLPTPGLDLYRLEGFEVFCERGPGYGTLIPKIVASNLLENPATSDYTPAAPIDLSQTPPTQPEGGDATGKFFGLRFEFTTPITLRWYGARLAARRIEPHLPADMRGMTR